MFYRNYNFKQGCSVHATENVPTIVSKMQKKIQTLIVFFRRGGAKEKKRGKVQMTFIIKQAK